MTGTSENPPVLSVHDLKVEIDGRQIINGMNFEAQRGEILGLIGPSGSGKSVTMRAIVRLLPSTGEIRILGRNYAELDREERVATQRKWGILFQQGALFSSLSVLENIEFPMREHLHLSSGLRSDIARLKLDLVGLPAKAAQLYPSELSGGMIKRAALARALALDPQILFLDEPTAGLDPIGAGKFDELIVTLRDTLDLTVLMVTHDLDSLATACDRIVALADGKLLLAGTMAEMRASTHPWLRDYFHGPRAHGLEG
ncbi:Methionine ABC transporter ATP-binding protein [Devosia sp. LC5]|uniref:ABC transporter ATP-binding protein n=1 Tax=Devosia sp. LC5 TaxID=1502724 RepID=UPI0004E37366|nr:ATP-binding cassette domain-containing protein [Devosia sp. LC5]KFC71307.1 Methionine ABC transporter ATP-binding protein [Devosia sp. LC5]